MRKNIREQAANNNNKFVVSFKKPVPNEGDVRKALLNVQSFNNAVKRSNFNWVLTIETGDPQQMVKRLSSFPLVSAVTFIGKETPPQCKKKLRFIEKLKKHIKKMNDFEMLDVQAMLTILTKNYINSCHAASSSSPAASSSASFGPGSSAASSPAADSSTASSQVTGSLTVDTLKKYLDT